MTIKGLYVLLDDEDYTSINRYRWNVSSSGYIQRHTSSESENKSRLLHRFIMECPTGLQVDHINGDRLDNRRSNLRICTPKQNSSNGRSRSSRRGRTSNFLGVSKWEPHPGHGKRHYWRARLKDKNLGYFRDEHIAALIHDFWADYIDGEYAALNFNKAN